MKSRIVSMMCAVALLAVIFSPARAQNVQAATVPYDAKGGAPVDREAMKARMQQRCKDNPKQCEEMKAKIQQRREQCKADPQKCREDLQARREARCKVDPGRCEEMKARMKQRREYCDAHPEQCRPRNKPAPGEK